MATIDRPQASLRIDLAQALAGRSRAELLEHAAMIALLAIWAVPFTRATGGRGAHNELLFAGALLLLLPAMQAWRAPSRSVVLAALVAVAALMVCVFAPSHWYGSDVAAGYAIGAAVFVAGRRYVRDGERRALIAASICLAGVYQFEQSFDAWWGSRSAATEMSGTFYWHNPYAAFLLPGAVLGLGLIGMRRSPWSLVGWFSVPICTAGIVFSSSRATMGALVVAWVLVLTVGLRGKAALLRGVGGIAIAALVVLALPGPPLFPHYSAPWAATVDRAASQSLAQNGGFRTEFWREAVQVAAHHPVVGSGFHELATASAFYTPSGWARSSLAHDGFLQAFSDGGLVLGLPFLLAVLFVLLWAIRPVWSAILRRRESTDGFDVVIAITILAALAHSAVDFDWSHPSILVEMALLAACIAPVTARPLMRRVSAAAFVALGGVLVVSLPALHDWQISRPNVTYSTDRLLSESSATFGDYRPSAVLLSEFAVGSRRMTLDQAKRALRLTSDAAKVDLHLALLRDAVSARIGVDPDAVAQAQATLRHVDGSTAPYVPDLALVLSGAGDTQAAQRVLAQDIAAQVASAAASPDLIGELSQWAFSLGTGSAYACELTVAAPILPSGPTGLPAPTASCSASNQGPG